MKVDEKLEKEDEYLKYYNQYRPKHSQYRDLDTRSLNSSSTYTTAKTRSNSIMNGTSSARSDYGQYTNSARPYGYPISRNEFNASYRGGANNFNGQGNNNRKLLIKSKSFVRDPRLLDLHNTYRRGVEQDNPAAYRRAGMEQDFLSQSSQPSSSQGYHSESRYGGEDSLSRDSGHSSAGTPELARDLPLGIARVNSCPSPSMYQENVGYNFGSYGLRDRFGNSLQRQQALDETQSLYSSFTRSTGQPSINTRSWTTEQPALTPEDTVSVGSLDMHLQNWNHQMSNNRNAKRKFDSFSEEEDLSLSETKTTPRIEQPAFKRPRSPTKEEINKDEVGMLKQAMKTIVKMLAVLLLVLFFLVSAMFIFSIVREFQCNQRNNLPINPKLLEESLNKNLFGQPVAQLEILEVVQEFSNQIKTSQSIKPLIVLVLVGWTGTGKTLTSNLVAASFPIPGNIHRIAGSSLSHPHTLVQELPSIISRSCGYNLVIVDDISDNQAAYSKIEKLVISLQSDEETRGNGTLLIISTSQGGNLVNRFIMEQIQNGHRDGQLTAGNGILSVIKSVTGNAIREHLDSQNFDIPLVSFFKEYGVDHKVIPFLPLTRDAVRSCIQTEVRETGVTLNSQDIANIMNQVPFFSQHLPVFSKIGCKKISAKVMLAARIKENANNSEL